MVTDSGFGISEEVVHRIFDPFFSTKEKKYGTGLGLSISKGLIERHHGCIEVDHSNANTRFVIQLPLRQTN
jgi:signal transduction histidine kinase